MNNCLSPALSMESEEYTEELRGCPVKGNAYPVLVLGVGNPLMGDDGIGVELAHRLQERDYGPLVHVEEGGTLGMTLLPLLEDADTVILLAAVKTGARPGTVVTRSRDELPRHFSRVISPHQIGMKEVLGAAQLCGTLPRIITLVGVEAGHTDFCQPMSAEVREAVPQALDLVETLIARALEEYQARKDAHA
ncbi:HyaD/HybD family hydrogenase maturation endopeptidase [Akkermansia sp.]|uniref:HyaD/HybD family hydrogenase maturation endopeptidase n=1 Tax=Akkermansia sp. TaxID=1872421 RepID=UPI003FD7F840